MAIEALAPEIIHIATNLEGPQQPDRSTEVLFNNPARALVYLVATANPHRPHTPAVLGNKINELQGLKPGWQLSPQLASAMPRTTCDTLLVPTQLLETTTTLNRSKKEVVAYRANGRQLSSGIAAAGAAIDWELQFPHLRASELLGQTRLNAKEAMPRTCLKIYQALLDTQYEATSLSDVSAYVGLPADLVKDRVDALVKKGILTKNSKLTFDRPIHVNETDKLYKNNGYRQLGLIGAIICDTAERLFKRGARTIDSSLFIAEVLDSHPDLDPSDIRSTLGSNPPKNVTFADTEDFDGKRTRLQIRSDLEPAIADLVLRHQNLQTNPAFVEAAIKRAYEILHDPAAVAFLMGKAKPESDAESLLRDWMKDRHAVVRARLGSLTLQRLPIEPRWEERAACKTYKPTADVDIFFPPGTQGPSREQAEVAKTICRACPVAVAASCLQWALDTGQQEGVFGRMTPEDRREYRNKPRVDVLQINPTRPRTNAEVSELLEDIAVEK